MTTFNAANQVRLALKMKLSKFYWYDGSLVINQSDGYAVVIVVKYLDNNIRKLISPVIDGVSVKVETK
jgi:hypothetical protein